MKEQKTAEQVLRETYHEYGIEYKPSHILSDSVAPIAMQSYSDQQNAELRERVKELQSQLAKYREALGRIANEDDEPLGDIGIVEAKWIAKEALKQREQ